MQMQQRTREGSPVLLRLRTHISMWLSQLSTRHVSKAQVALTATCHGDQPSSDLSTYCHCPNWVPWIEHL